MTSSSPETQLNTTLEPGLYRKLKIRAARDGVTIKSIINYLIQEYVSK
jgi:hypothetical protein